MHKLFKVKCLIMIALARAPLPSFSLAARVKGPED